MCVVVVVRCGGRMSSGGLVRGRYGGVSGCVVVLYCGWGVLGIAGSVDGWVGERMV